MSRTLVLLVAAAAVLGTAGWMLFWRRRRARGAAPEAAGAPQRTPEHGETMRCPTCQTEYPPGVRFCAVDARPLMPASQLESATTHSATCRGCGRAFDLSIRFCPFDGAELGGLSPAVLAPPPAARALATISRVAKICPHCNQRYASHDAFCGRDGSTLVALN